MSQTMHDLKTDILTDDPLDSGSRIRGRVAVKRAPTPRVTCPLATPRDVFADPRTREEFLQPKSQKLLPFCDGTDCLIQGGGRRTLTRQSEATRGWWSRSPAPHTRRRPRTGYRDLSNP